VELNPAPDPTERRRELAAILADPAAFRRWYERAVVIVYRYLFTRCAGDATLAEELTQQTFIQAIDRRATYEGRADATTWLCTIGRNLLTDHYRRLDQDERRHLRLVVREINPDHGEADRFRAVEDRDQLIAALGQLPPLQRAAVVLCYIDGLSVREAAKALDRSEGATESLLSRARERLRQILQEDADGR
jgi:RNA polymerase sigma-70 factor, ECF subfamily